MAPMQRRLCARRESLRGRAHRSPRPPALPASRGCRYPCTDSEFGGQPSGRPAGEEGCCSTSMPLRCLIVDDNAKFLEAARFLLDHEGLVVVGVATSSAEAVSQAQALRPDLALIDIQLGEENGVRAD